MKSNSYSFEEAEKLFDEFENLNSTDPMLLKRVLQKKSELKMEKFNELYNKLVEMHNNPKAYKNVKAKTRGNILEEIIKVLTIKTKTFEVFDNITNDSNEFDLIIKPSELAKKSYNALPSIIYQPIICECKNYQKSVDVTWLGKFYMLLSTSNIKLGIIFSYEGVTSEGESNWENAIGLIRKIYLKDRIAIISINKDDLKRIVDGELLYNIVEEKYINLQMMTDIENEKRFHPSVDRVNEILEKIQKEIAENKKIKNNLNT